MAISISVADYITLRRLCQLLQSRPHIATAHRWATRGIRGIRLPTYLVGGSRMTTLADFEKWVAEVSASRSSHDQATANTPPDTHVPNTRSRQRQIDQAERQLDQRGVPAEPP